MYGYPALELYNVYGTTIQNLQFRHSVIALSDYSGYYNYHYVQNCQFLDCYRGINSYYTPVYCSYRTMCSVYEPYVDQGVLDGSYSSPLLQHSYTTTLSGCSGGVAFPVCDPPGNVYNGAQLVTVTCPTPDVTIRYRLVDAFHSLYEVTESDPVIPNGGQVQVDGAKALVLRAWKNGIPKFSSLLAIHSFLTKIDFPAGTANGTFAGTYFMPIDLGDYRFDFAGMNVLVDGGHYEPSYIPSPWVMPYLQAGPIVEFDRLENGAHTIQAKVSFLRNDILGRNSDFVELTTPVTPFQANNTIWYPDWNDQIGSGTYTVKVRTIKPNTAFTITVKDHSGTAIKTLTGQTDAQGGISANWNLTDNQGNQRGSLPGDPFITFDLTVHSTPVALFGWGKKAVPEFPAAGDWVVAAMDGFLGYEDAFSNQQGFFQELVGAIAGAATYSGAGVTPFPLYFTDGNAFYGNPEPYGQAADLQDIQNIRNARWNAFKGLLGNSGARNLYYNGHGFNDLIGGDVPDKEVIGGQEREIGARIKRELGSSAFLTQHGMLGLRKAKLGLNAGYRFVFLPSSGFIVGRGRVCRSRRGCASGSFQSCGSRGRWT
jgi:hypothetical protein